MDEIITYIYDSYDIPKPELLKDFASGKQMDKAFENLTKRCRNKSIEWRIGLKNLVRMVFEIKRISNLYSDIKINDNYKLDVVFHFRTFETPEEKAVSLLPLLEAGAMSLETYLSRIGVEDVEAEIARIISNKRALSEDAYLSNLMAVGSELFTPDIANTNNELSTGENNIEVE